MKQTITIVIDTNGQLPYAEPTASGYAALEHFFTDIDYKVQSIKIENEVET